MHAASDLEHLILRWQSTKAGWLMQESSKAIPSKRHFVTYDKRSSCVYLVEGGRFLLVGNKSGAVNYYDLSAHVITPSTLVQQPSDEEVGEMKISVDVDFDVEFLSFRLGILTRSKSHPYVPNASLSICRIQVWQVTSSIDENGLVNGLSSERKASFLEEYQAICFAFRLQGSYVLYSLFYPPTQELLFSGGHRTVIVNWRLPDSTSLLYARQILPHANATVTGIFFFNPYRSNVSFCSGWRCCQTIDFCATQISNFGSMTSRPRQPPAIFPLKIHKKSVTILLLFLLLVMLFHIPFFSVTRHV